MIFYAGIYTDEDMDRMAGVVSEKVIKFIPITEKLKRKGIKQLQHEVNKYRYEVVRHSKIVEESKEQIEVLKSQLEFFKNSFNIETKECE
jgi:predicted RNase H-like nuclease (RuvC/YqgF family)